MPLTLKDIARKAGVAESTVSRALNDKPGVSEEKRKEIIQIARKHNYQPNQLAQGLAKQETHMIALLLSQLENPDYTEIIKNIERSANRAGYQIILCNTDGKPQKEKNYFELLKQNIVDGAIIVGGRLTEKNILNIVLNEEAPIVLLNRLSEEITIPSVLIDKNRGGYLAGQHLVDQGLQEIAAIMGPEDNYQESEKINGFEKALYDNDLTANPRLIKSGPLERGHGYNSFLELMEQGEMPDGFFVSHSLLAAGLTEAIKMGGYHIPGDFPIVCYGDNLISSIINPSLTIISEPLAEAAHQASNKIISLLKGETISQQISVLKPSINVRDSSLPQFKNNKK